MPAKGFKLTQTVSVYRDGQHIVTGEPVKVVLSQEKYGRPSLNGGYGSFMLYLEDFLKDYKTGDRVEITVRVKPRKKSR